MNPSNVMYSQSQLRDGTSAVSNLRIFRSENSSYIPGETGKVIVIPINATAQSFIDFSETTISWKFTNRSYSGSGGAVEDSSAILCGGMLGAVRSLEIQGPTGNRLEFIDNYNLLNALLYDYQSGTDHATSVEHQLCGMSRDGTTAKQAKVASAATAGTAPADGSSLTLSDNLVSGVLSSRMLFPAGWLSGSPCRIILTLADPMEYLSLEGDGNSGAAKSHYKIENVELRAKEVRFNEVFNQNFLESLNAKGAEGMSFYGQTFLNTTNNIPASASGEQNLQFSGSCASAKAIMCMIRPQANVSALQKNGITERHTAGMTSYRFEINGEQRPSQKIDISNTNISQAYSQVLEAFGTVGDLSRATLINDEATGCKYYDTTETDATKFIVALPLEDYGADDRTISGLNLSLVGAPIRFIPTLSPEGTLAAQQVQNWIWCDAKYVFTVDGRMEVQY